LGTHAELLELKGKYFQFWELQSKAYKDDNDGSDDGESVATKVSDSEPLKAEVNDAKPASAVGNSDEPGVATLVDLVGA
jgi:hypothetical protein